MGKKQRNIILLILGITTLSILFVNASGPEYYWKSTFRDEFNGSQLNRNKWATRYFWNGQGGRSLREQHGELQCYRDGNVSVANGKLVIKAVAKDNWCGGWQQEYNSGMISSHDSHAQLYGYFEARIDIPKGQGTWPAFWTMPKKPGPGIDPDRAEIDIFEHLGRQPDRLNFNYHWEGDNNEAHKHIGKMGKSPIDGFHTYATLWEKNKITWYFNGKKVHQIRSGQFPGMYLPSQPMYMIANLAIGGNWAGNPTNQQKQNFNKTMKIDYMRAFQKRNSRGPRPNKVKNAGFENGKNSWKTWGNTSISKDEFQGSQAIRLRGSAGANQTISGLRPYSVYRLSALVKDYDGKGNGKAATQLGVKNYGGAQQLTDWRIIKNKYKRLEIVFTTGNTDKATIFVFQNNGDAVIDKFELKAL